MYSIWQMRHWWPEKVKQGDDMDIFVFEKDLAPGSVENVRKWNKIWRQTDIEGVCHVNMRTVIYKLRRKAWGGALPHSPQKELPALPTPPFGMSHSHNCILPSLFITRHRRAVCGWERRPQERQSCLRKYSPTFTFVTHHRTTQAEKFHF